jgi:hypothetical protein
MTRPASTLSEAMSYYRLAKAGNVYQNFMNEEEKARGTEFERVTTEVSWLASTEGGRVRRESRADVSLRGVGFRIGFVSECPLFHREV